MKKIVHIVLNGPVTDGWNYQDNMLTKYHKRLGYDVTIITSQWIWGTEGKLVRSKKTDYINDDGVKVIRLPMKGREDFNRKLRRFKRLYETLQNERPDILFIHGPGFLDISVIVKYLKSNNVEKVYVDNHADGSNSGTNILSKYILQKGIWRHTAQMIEPYADKFYGVLPIRVDWLIDMYKLPPKKCELLVMGADDEKVEEALNSEARERIREKYSIGEDDFLIMTGGKIDPWKTQTLLLMEAVNNMKSEKVKLIVFGSVVPELKEKINDLCSDKVQYIGWVKSELSYDYFAAADLVAFPGRHSVFWEQVAGMGIPMVCKYWEGTTHVDLGGNVKFLYKDSAEEIRSVVEEIVQNRELYNAMKSCAEENGMKTFSYKDIARRSIDMRAE